MGILRTILALAVIVFHSYKIFGLRMCGGQVAVQSFYMISGFYMALILNEKYIGSGNYLKFIKSRFLRIFPVYWLVLLAAVLVSIIGFYGFDKPYYLARYISNKDCLSFLTILFFIIENIIVFGQDILYFLKMNEFCEPVFTYHSLSYNHNAYQYLFVPQAWTISIECMFYLIAPFLVTKKIKWQLLIIFLSLVLRIVYARFFNLSFDPWTYRFFPFELAFFMAGSLAYQYYKHRLTIQTVSFYTGYLLLFSLILGIIFYHEIPIEQTLKNYVFFGLVALVLPYIFNAFKNNKVDRYIGELSFSLYIVHHIIVSVFRGWFFSHIAYIPYYGYAVVCMSIIMAVIMQYFIIRPLELYRHKRFS